MLPAHAGMIPGAETHIVIEGGAPRACGDDPKRETSRLPYIECSPRMRG